MKLINYALLALLAALLPISPFSNASATPTSTQASPPHTSKKITSTSPPSAQEIDAARAKGLVWVNTSTHVYHKEGSSYGTTKHGKFMTEDDAKKAGFRAARVSGAAKSKATSDAMAK